ncbi:deoxyribonuclease IV [Spiroplasma turonicum]|uniref:Probable endonuclease 4 n=1 Tax=Spiroplasma turonicum TaxID=216946 RepID=A0A0K1P6B7_9MOLU|nr:deoxyribonuclease IV [Spiroplasma turonicum]AKU79734.1 endonuclease IV [Spiroplasma turonicum]ALX70752.1 endonuclease IV [Spiroplasma turonicum]
MNKRDYFLGCHVGMNATNNYLVGSVEEAITNNANTFMFFTGAPQNTRRTETSKLKIKEFNELLIKYNFNKSKLVCHGPYTINLANTIKKDTFDLGVRLLKEEILRLNDIGVSKLVLHPGAAVGAELQVALDSLIKGLDMVLLDKDIINIDITVALETMSGKGTEICTNFDQLKYVLTNSKCNDKLSVCIDTCHINDAGYDIKNNLNDVINEFDLKIGLEKLSVIHLNDSKNEINSHKDRHHNIGYGKIGFDVLNKIVHNPIFKNIPIILETPWINNFCPYKDEIQMLDNSTFNNPFKDLIKE